MRNISLNIRPFTLPELLVVLTILALHAALLAPTLSRAREEARRSLCAANLRQTGAALSLFGQDHEAMPASDNSGDSFQMLLEADYLPDQQILSCPSNAVDVDTRGGPADISYYIDLSHLFRAPIPAHLGNAVFGGGGGAASYGDTDPGGGGAGGGGAGAAGDRRPGGNAHFYGGGGGGSGHGSGGNHPHHAFSGEGHQGIVVVIPVGR